MRKRNGRSWRPVAGAVGICLLAFGLNLHGAPAGSNADTSVDGNSSVESGASSAVPASLRTGLEPVVISSKQTNHRAKKVYLPPSIRIDGEDIRLGRVESIVPAGGTVRARNIDSGTADFYASEGTECTCDADCPAPVEQCSRANCLNGVCRELFRPNNAWCDLDGLFCTQDRCDGGGECLARTLSRCIHECDDASADTGNTCISTGSCNPGDCVPVGVCNEDQDRCELSPDKGRCCESDLTCTYVSEADCNSVSGNWLRLADTDDTNDQCFCPTYSAGIAPRTSGGVDVGPIRPSALACAGAVASQINSDDPIRRCVDPELDCPKRCVGGTNQGDICQTDPDCPSSSCGFDTCVDVAAHCHAGFRRIGDDYSVANGSYLKLKRLRIHGGVENSREILTFQFYDNSDPPKLVDTQAFIFNTRGSGNDFITFNFDCAPDCNVDRDEDARSEPFVIPPNGWVVMRTIRNLDQDPGGGSQEPGEFGNGHWVTTDVVDVEGATANDPTMMWVDDGPTTTLPDGVTTGILSFELEGVPIPDPKGACCSPDVAGDCTDTNIWGCRECTRETDPNTRVCGDSRDCGLTDFCIEPNWHGPRTRGDFESNAGDLCEGGICDSGSCCLPDGGCQVTDPDTCEDAGGLNGTFLTPGGSCDPNCCEQPVPTGGDCCADIMLCENGGSTREDEDCLSNSDCDQDLGRCADDNVCSIAAQDCLDASTCQGTNNCSLCKGATTVTFDVPTFVLSFNDPDRTVRIDISGTTTNAAFGRQQGDTCTFDNTDFGWYEKFGFQGHCETDPFATGGPDCSLDSDCDLAAGESCVGGCAVVTMNYCCTSPLFSPVFIGIADVTDTCLCDEFTDFVAVDRNAAGVAKRGFGLDCDHDQDPNAPSNPDAQPCCEDGNYSLQFSLLSGTYFYQLSAGKFCQNSVQECLIDDDCTGVPCTFEGQDYQWHYTVTPCRRAACCLNIPCTSDADCLDVYTSTCNTDKGFCNSSCLQTTKLECEGFAPNGIIPDIPGDWLGDLDPAVAQCSANGTPAENVCKEGACCTGPGACNDDPGPSPADFTSLDGCLADDLENVYHGGITCAENPCPVCPFLDAAHCQRDDPASFAQSSDRNLRRRLVDDVRVPADGIIDRVCWAGCWTPPQFPTDLPACDESPPNNNEDWQIVFYEDNLGLPDESTRTEYIVIPDAAVLPDGTACWDLSTAIDPPLQVVGGDCIWVEITGKGSSTCVASLAFSNEGNSYSYRDSDGAYGVEDLSVEDFTFCVSSGLTPGSIPFDDGGCGDLVGACCTAEPGGTPACDDSGSLATRAACNDASGYFVPEGTCGAGTCPNPANDLCENAEPVCPTTEPDPDIGVCQNDPDEQPCLKSADSLVAGSCLVLGDDFGPCVDLPVESTSARCSFDTDNRLAQTDGSAFGSDNCGAGDFHADVWYTLTSPCTGRMHVSMCGAATYDGMLAVYGNQSSTCVSCPLNNNSLLLQCNDDFCGGQFSTTSAVNIEVIKGACYTMRVGGWSGIGTAFNAGQSLSMADVLFTCDAVADALSPVLPGSIAGIDHNIVKNRFLSIKPNNESPVTLRVELLDLACSATGKKCNSTADCKACVGGGNNGQGCSIGSDCPNGSCELSGETCDEQSSPVLLGWVGDPFEAGGDAPSGTLTSRIVRTQPDARSWIEPIIHVADCQVAPVNTYGISATTDNVLFSDPPLVIGTIEQPQGKFWGDVVGNFNGVTWTGPNVLVNVDDIVAMIGFLTLKPAPHVTVLDIVGGAPTFVNFDVNATDLLVVLQAFGGQEFPPPSFVAEGYPADGDVTQCP